MTAIHIEHRTSNIERPTFNREKKENGTSFGRSVHRLLSPVGRWMFDVRCSTFSIALLVFAVFAPPLHPDESSAQFLWEQANARMAAARTPDDFLATARIYNQLVTDGIRNGPLFFNLGTALLLAGDGENAAAALRRAERYLGSTPELRVNLRQALALQLGQPDADLPWDHMVFFWHYDEPLRVRAEIALCGWLLVWLALLLRRFTRSATRSGIVRRLHSFANSCLFFGLLLLMVFTCSAAFSWLQEQWDDRTWAERVFVSKPIAEQPP